MWLSFSPDLKHWGDHMLLLEARDHVEEILRALRERGYQVQQMGV